MSKPERVRVYDENGKSHLMVLRTKTGKVITQAMLDQLTEEAERGYDVSKLTASVVLCPPHPKRRVIKGYCGRCGRQVGQEKTSLSLAASSSLRSVTRSFPWPWA